MSEDTKEIIVKECEPGDVPLGSYAQIPVGCGLEEAVKRYRKWPRTTRVRVPEVVYQTKLGFYFPLED